jgi:hypothetical protein
MHHRLAASFLTTFALGAAACGPSAAPASSSTPGTGPAPATAATEPDAGEPVTVEAPPPAPAPVSVCDAVTRALTLSREEYVGARGGELPEDAGWEQVANRPWLETTLVLDGAATAISSSNDDSSTEPRRDRWVAMLTATGQAEFDRVHAELVACPALAGVAEDDRDNSIGLRRVWPEVGHGAVVLNMHRRTGKVRIEVQMFADLQGKPLD